MESLGQYGVKTSGTENVSSAEGVEALRAIC